MKANANLEGAAAGVEHRKEREVFPSLIHARPPLPHGGKFFPNGCLAPAPTPSVRAFALRGFRWTDKTHPGRGRGFSHPGGM